MKALLIAAIFVCCFVSIHAQVKNFSFNIESQIGYTSNSTVPFWMRSNQYGSFPLPGLSFSLLLSAKKVYDTSKKRLFDWGFGFEERNNVGQKIQAVLIEGYGKLKVWVFELKGGRSKEVMGLSGDTVLSS